MINFFQFRLLGLSVLGGCALYASSALAQSVEPPEAIKKAGKIVYCSDIANPPRAFYDENNQAIGSDIDIGNEIAKRLGVKAQWDHTIFAGIIPALQAKHCDAILSNLFDKPARREVVDFVDYTYASQALLVVKGNPKNIKTLEDLSGHKVAVENGTNIQALIEAENKKLQEAGKAPAEIVVYPKNSDALQALQFGQVDAFGNTMESSAYFMTQTDVFAFGGEPFAKIIAGIATRKDDKQLHDAIQKAFDAIKADGTNLSILKKWHIEQDEF